MNTNQKLTALRKAIKKDGIHGINAAKAAGMTSAEIRALIAINQDEIK